MCPHHLTACSCGSCNRGVGGGSCSCGTCSRRTRRGTCSCGSCSHWVGRGSCSCGTCSRRTRRGTCSCGNCSHWVGRGTCSCGSCSRRTRRGTCSCGSCSHWVVSLHGLGSRGQGQGSGDLVDLSPFGFARDVVRSWYGTSGSGSASWAPRCPPGRPPSPPLMVDTAADNDNVDNGDGCLPGTVPASSEGDDSDPSEASSSDSDETMSTSSPGAAGMTFNEQVRVLPIPPIEDFTHEQLYRKYTNRFELRENKARNKREYKFDGHDWRNTTEENAMAICPLSGELLHPAHL
ncbi:hypothetical protein ACHAW5_003816 [Stephanodiscus triporus]|uniref:Uncharacterized protein n=1 Tax=Stephanodiscus triporus TaxID=2934178 RepID=A0ABD3NEP7_9STRA